VTASPTAAGAAAPLVVAVGPDKKSVVVTEPGAATPVGVHVQVTC
jgi:hypothetical protein